jgi:ABC-type transport system substrate-binding protein
MNLIERHSYRPYVKSVVTEDPWIIGCYDYEKVRVLDDETVQWTFPHKQTYGASVNNITLTILGIRSTMPAMTFDGGEDIRKHVEQYKKLVELANKA